VIDAVLSYHVNVETCGVAKFNQQLSEHLGVPCQPLNGLIRGHHPLVSLKWSELAVLPRLAGLVTFDLLWHDRHPGQATLNKFARHVYYADELGCPSTLRGNPTRHGLGILSFGMMHKFSAQHFERLKMLLDASGHAYTLSVSSAIHEGSPWDTTTMRHTAALRDLFGSHVRWLGYLADDALSREIRNAHTVALFYSPAVRANNTTIWAALEAGTPVITNLDAQSPPELQHGVSVFDIAQMTEWPEYDGKRQDIRAGGRKAAGVYSWERVLQTLTATVSA
jgi:hypothetical protein